MSLIKSLLIPSFHEGFMKLFFRAVSVFDIFVKKKLMDVFFLRFNFVQIDIIRSYQE